MSGITRRQFVSTAATGAATWGVHQIARADAGAPSAATRAGRQISLGVIGCGGRGQDVLANFLATQRVRCLAVCDVDDAMSGAAAKKVAEKQGKTPDSYRNFRELLERKDIDAVLVATPDHWHALPTIEACQAGKDVYVEKPLATTIVEGRAMVSAARKHNRVVQMGTQWRSAKHFQDAIAYVHSGQLGQIRQVRTWAYLAWLKSVGKPVDGAVPPGVDYDLWLGPAPKRPFNPGRFHFNFRWFWDYAGGLMTDWGVHLINIALWGMKAPPPVRVSGHGGKMFYDDISETPDTQCAVYDFPNFLLTWEHQGGGSGQGPENHYHGVAFYGSQGKLIVSADFWEVVPEKKSPLKPERHDGAKNEGVPQHVGNFLDCVISRQKPTMDVELGHQVTTVAHLGNLALQSKKSLTWDAAKERITNDEDANKLLTREYRAPWRLPT